MARHAIGSGDIVWVDFEPAYGHEQGGRRPALVLSVSEYNERSSFVLVCPITTSRRQWSFNLPLTGCTNVEGSVIVDQIRSIDKRRIVSQTVEQLSAEGLEEVRGKLAAVIGIVL